MNILDIIILGVIFLSAFIGFWRGLTREILGILSWVFAGITTYFLHTMAEPFVGVIISSPFIKGLISGLLVFILSLIVLTSITYRFSDAVRSSIVGGADKILGFLFGSFRGFLFIAAAAFGANKYMAKKENIPSVLAGSKIIPVAGAMLERIIQSIPTSKLNEWKDSLESALLDASAKGNKKFEEIVNELPDNNDDAETKDDQ